MPFFDTEIIFIVVLMVVIIIAGVVILVGTGSTEPDWHNRHKRH